MNNGLLQQISGPVAMPYGLLGAPAPVPLIDRAYAYDSDAASYINRVENADRAPLELGVRVAIDEFVRGCKQDDIWNAIKASCILSGARTLNGALVPLVGNQPTNVGFVSSLYGRLTGLDGDVASYLLANRQCSFDEQNNVHIAAYAERNTGNARYIGSDDAAGTTHIELIGSSTGGFRTRTNSTTITTHSSLTTSPVFLGTSRNNSSSYNWIFDSNSGLQSNTSTGRSTGGYAIFANNNGESASGTRIYFYSIGSSLNLGLLRLRVLRLIQGFDNAL